MTKNIPQYSPIKSVFMFLWPALWFIFLIYIIGGTFVADPSKRINTDLFMLIWALGNGGELVVAMIILYREGNLSSYKTFKERVKLKRAKASWKTWLLVLGVFTVAIILSMVLKKPTQEFMLQIGIPPAWMPGHPLAPSPKSIGEAYAVANMEGNYSFLIIRYLFLGLILNMFSEELYYRAVLMPKMEKAFGKYNVVANTIGFTLKHAYYYWRLPMIIPGAFAFTRLGSLPAMIVLHWCANMEPMQIILAIKEVLGL